MWTKARLVNMAHNLLSISKNLATKLLRQQLLLLLGLQELDWSRECKENDMQPCVIGSTHCRHHTLVTTMSAAVYHQIRSALPDNNSPTLCCIVHKCSYPQYREGPRCLEHLARHYHQFYRRSVHVYIVVRELYTAPRLVVGTTNTGMTTVFGGFCELGDANPVETGIREFMEETHGKLLSRHELTEAIHTAGTIYTGRTATHIFVDIDHHHIDIGNGSIQGEEVECIEFVSLDSLADHSLRVGLQDHHWLLLLHIMGDHEAHGLYPGARPVPLPSRIGYHSWTISETV
jgi:8-oxo-dGTP pyrophosphatase MutT (NUDIX family)